MGGSVGGLLLMWLCHCLGVWMGGCCMVGTWICERIFRSFMCYKSVHGHMCSCLLEFINGNSQCHSLSKPTYVRSVRHNVCVDNYMCIQALCSYKSLRFGIS